MNTQTKQRLLIILILAVVVIVSLYVWKNSNKTVKSPSFIEEPVSSVVGPAVLTGAGVDTAKDLSAFSIMPGTKVHGILSYRGTISGGYFFEGNILINILDANKKVLKNSNAVAKTEWMTSGPVDFEGNIDFTNIAKGPAYIEIHNDNASGLPEKDKSVLIPIIIY